MAGRGRGLVLDRLLSRSSKQDKTKDKDKEITKKDEPMLLKSPEQLLKLSNSRTDSHLKTNFPLLVGATSPTSFTNSTTNAGVGRGSPVSKLMTPNQFKIASPTEVHPGAQNKISSSVSQELSAQQFDLSKERDDDDNNDDDDIDIVTDSDDEEIDSNVDENEEENDKGESNNEIEKDEIKDENINVEIDTTDFDEPDEDSISEAETSCNEEDESVSEQDEIKPNVWTKQDVTKPKENAVQKCQPIYAERVARVAPTVGTSSPISPAQKVTLAEKEKAEFEWNQLKLERKVKKLLNGICDTTLDNVLKELPFLLRDKSFGDESHNCKVVLTILFDKATQSNDVSLYVPCLLKHLADQAYASVKAALPGVVSKLSDNLVKVVKSDKLISEANERFCNILGILFTFPVVYNESFHGLISPLVESCVKGWTHTTHRKVSMAPLSGHRLDIAVVHTYALGYLLKRISLRLSDDDKPQKEMDSFITAVRMSILNDSIPRQLRNIYLELILSDANEWPDDVFPHLHINVHSKDPLLLPDDDNEAIENQSNSTDATQPEQVSKSSASKPENGTQRGNAKPDDKKESTKECEESSDAAAPSDPYSEITAMLTELDLMEELGRFKTNIIRDVSLHSHADSVKLLLKEAEFPPGLSREILWYLKSKGITKDTFGNRQQSGTGFRVPRGNATPHFKPQTPQFNRNDKSWRRAESPSPKT